MTAAGKVVRWHRLPFQQFVAYEASRPLFRPFLYGAAGAFFICGILPASGASDEDKNKSKYWKRINGKFEHGHH